MGARSHEEATIESFRDDPEFAAEYLNQVLEDGDQDELMVALRRLAGAFGGEQIAEAADLRRDDALPHAFTSGEIRN